MALGIMISVAEERDLVDQGLLLKQQPLLTAIIEQIFTHMVKISQDIPEEWTHPPPGTHLLYL